MQGVVRIAALDRAGLEPLPRYCARLLLALERFEVLAAQRLIKLRLMRPNV